MNVMRPTGPADKRLFLACWVPPLGCERIRSAGCRPGRANSVYTLQLDYEAYIGYLDESQRELVRIGIVKCARLRDQSQLGAVVLLLIRASSLFRSVLMMLAREQPFDALDAVRRAYLETWLLALEFRLEDSQAKATHWHRGKEKSWSANIQRLMKYSQSQGAEPMLGRDYGGLSKMAHPTKDAASNSLVLVTAPHEGASLERISLCDARANLEAEMPMMMYRFLWLILEERTGLIPVGIDCNALPTAFAYANRYAAFSGRTVAP